MADSYSKKENNKKKVKKKQDKLTRREERKTTNNKGKSLEEMLVYVDANGNLTSIPPHLQPTLNVTINDKEVLNDTSFSKGIITFISEKGYGFITETITNDSVFFNVDSNLYKKGVKVTFKKEKGFKGFKANEIIIN